MPLGKVSPLKRGNGGSYRMSISFVDMECVALIYGVNVLPRAFTSADLLV